MNYTVKHVSKDLSNEDKNFLLTSNQPLSIDTETTGLDARIHELRLIQIALGDTVYIIRFNSECEYKNLIEVLNSGKWKFFHNATFDVKFLLKNIPKLVFKKIVCTKITAKIISGPKSTSSLKPLLEHYCGIFLDKSMQTSDWSNQEYSRAQIEYAVRDVLFLPVLYKAMEPEIIERNLSAILQKCYDFVPIQAQLELSGFDNIFKY